MTLDFVCRIAEHRTHVSEPHRISLFLLTALHHKIQNTNHREPTATADATEIYVVCVYMDQNKVFSTLNSSFLSLSFHTFCLRAIIHINKPHASNFIVIENHRIIIKSFQRHMLLSCYALDRMMHDTFPLDIKHPDKPDGSRLRDFLWRVIHFSYNFARDYHELCLGFEL